MHLLFTGTADFHALALTGIPEPLYCVLSLEAQISDPMALLPLAAEHSLAADRTSQVEAACILVLADMEAQLFLLLFFLLMVRRIFYLFLLAFLLNESLHCKVSN